MNTTLTAALLIVVRAIVQVCVGMLLARGIQIGVGVEELTAAIVFIMTVAWSIYEKHALLAKQTNKDNEKTPE